VRVSTAAFAIQILSGTNIAAEAQSPKTRSHFAKGCADDEKLSDVLHKLDEPSLSALVEDHEAGTLEAGCGG
jgi:hypothetical protein